MANFESNLKSLFNILADLRQEFNYLNVEAENLNEIAMNAAVTAGQTGKSIRVYTEISNHIAISSKKMKSFILKNRNEVNSILNLTLKILSNDMMNNKYHLVNSSKSLKNNVLFIDEKIKILRKLEYKTIKELITHVYQTKSFLKSILQLQYKLFGVYNCLLIEAIQLEGTSYSAIKTLSESLYHSFEITISSIDKLFLILKKISRLVKVISLNY
ncbi:hypothetical protein GCL60_00755 [Silvanigrella paludirubra]|uniref:Uncharacterized protein n=1 Tax=Silvanigrella paludirubra TaxID=2499159 RepID=A0A6N6VXL6_9BACT|nr:hypothetical protein [Silvanigrella paludirubra]KAB8040477.1 hypothetical protein GCL60_00755 [Silvanigrella paludirubra]